MNFAWSPEQEQMRAAIERVCAPFDADYWLRKDREGGFPDDFHRALADAGWLGIAMPEAYGGAGLGISEAALMMHTIAASGAGPVGRVGGAHEHLRPASGGGVRQRRAEGALAAAADRGPGPRLLRASPSPTPA